MTTTHHTQVLVVGAGPAGLIAALQLATNSVPSMLIERNLETTKWPKMDLTNVRSMEILRRLGIAEGLRKVGVPGHFSFDVNFSSGLSGRGESVHKWHLPSTDEFRERIKTHNDGSMPREPYQRCSQAVFEAWLKPQIQESRLIKSMFGWKLTSLAESDQGVKCEIADQEGITHIIHAQYIIGCDGAGSRVRRSIGISMTGGPVPGAMYLIHFKSKDLTRLHKQGQFWHTFFTNSSLIIAQDEKDTWTVHSMIPIDLDVSTLDPEEVIYKALGGSSTPFPIKIDEILVTSNWRPNIYLADKYISGKGRVFLAGDSVHQNIPTGGYGMNTALGDSFDIGWKIAAVLQGHGGDALLRSYESERRPVGAKNIDQSGIHWSVHAAIWEWCAETDVTSQDESGRDLRERIAKHVMEHDAENKSFGLELGYRYGRSRIINHEDDSAKEPEWSLTKYIPSTWPGVRAPHVFLNDQVTSIHDLFGSGQQYTLIDFSATGTYIQAFQPISENLSIPIKYVLLPDETHARTIWERDAVLIRPDDHVAWRAPLTPVISELDIETVLLIVVGKLETADRGEISSGYFADMVGSGSRFAGTIENVDVDGVEKWGAFQT